MRQIQTPSNPPPVPAPPGDRLVTTRDTCNHTTLCRQTIWRLVRDGRFPAPLQLTRTRVAWRLSDIEQWIREKAAGRN